MSITILPMTRERMHELYRGFAMDPAIFMDMELFERVREYRYNAEKVDAQFDRRSREAGSV